MAFLEEQPVLDKEQEELDQHIIETGLALGTWKVITKSVSHIKNTLSTIEDQITSMAPGSVNLCHIQHEEQLFKIQKELGEVSTTPLALDLDKHDELMIELSNAFDIAFAVTRYP